MVLVTWAGCTCPPRGGVQLRSYYLSPHIVDVYWGQEEHVQVHSRTLFEWKKVADSSAVGSHADAAFTARSNGYTARSNGAPTTDGTVDVGDGVFMDGEGGVTSVVAGQTTIGQPAGWTDARTRLAALRWIVTTCMRAPKKGDRVRLATPVTSATRLARHGLCTRPVRTVSGMEVASDDDTDTDDDL